MYQGCIPMLYSYENIPFFIALPIYQNIILSISSPLYIIHYILMSNIQKELGDLDNI